MTPTINTQYICPPIEIRDFDWCATWFDYDGAPDAPPQHIGYGATEKEAVRDLLKATIEYDLESEAS